MSYIAYNADKKVGNVIGTGQCVAFVQQAANAPLTSLWTQGVQVKGNTLLQKGTAIATFQDGRYQNSINGDSHAAIYVKQDVKGIWVLDQWKNADGTFHAVSERLIRFRNGVGRPVNDGDQYRVIE